MQESTENIKYPEHGQINGERVYIVDGAKKGWAWPCGKCGMIRSGFTTHRHEVSDVKLTGSYWAAMQAANERLLDESRAKNIDGQNEAAARKIAEEVSE